MRLPLALLVCAASALALAEMPKKVLLPCDAAETSLSQTGKHVAVRCKDDSVHLVGIPDGKELVSFPATDRFHAFAFSPDDRLFAAGSLTGDVVVVPLSNALSRKRWHVAKQDVVLVSFVSATNLVAAPEDLPGQVWDFSSEPAQKATLETDFGGLTGAAVSPDEQFLVTTGADTVVRFYTTAGWKMTAEYRNYTLEPFSAAFSSDGKYAIVGGADRQLTLFDPGTGREVRKLPVHADPVWEIHPTDPDHLAVLYIDADGLKPPHLLLWDLKSGTSHPVAMDATVTGGGVVDGKVWLSKTNANSLELVTGN